jgi:alkanesulfonate monooxygenase SsuD/methylene tetrahydromethanopterin reductase-like flavin-dependent oxidoreductase (luciferase family)
MVMRLLLSARQHGWHPAAWRVSDAPVFSPADLLEMAKQAEQAEFDVVLFGLPSLAPGAPGDGSEGSMRLEPLPVMGAAIGVTSRIGLGAFWPLDIAEPFHVARVMATLDHLSQGRAAWITDSTMVPAPACDQPGSNRLAERASEFADVVTKLWDSWEDSGFVADQSSGIFADPERVHPINHEGQFFKVRGPLNLPRPVQGWPVVIYRDHGQCDLRDSVSAYADLVIAALPDIDAARSFRRELDSARTGRSRRPLLIASMMPVLARTTAEAEQRAKQLDHWSRCALPSFVGTPEEFVSELVRWHKSGACDGFDIRPAVMPLDLDFICLEVMPQLRRALGPDADRPAAGTLRERLGLDRPASQYGAA